MSPKTVKQDGSRVPLALRIFLTALAIVDDLLAVLVIAVFYTENLDVAMLGGGVSMIVASLSYQIDATSATMEISE